MTGLAIVFSWSFSSHPCFTVSLPFVDHHTPFPIHDVLGVDKAPRLDKFAGVHLTADQYHEAMQQDNTVIVDVRNAYETTLGRFQPPAGGAQLLDPKLRHSNEFPNWLADPKTQEKLHGKTVLMYCTGRYSNTSVDSISKYISFFSSYVLVRSCPLSRNKRWYSL